MFTVIVYFIFSPFLTSSSFSKAVPSLFTAVIVAVTPSLIVIVCFSAFAAVNIKFSIPVTILSGLSSLISVASFTPEVALLFPPATL